MHLKWQRQKHLKIPHVTEQLRTQVKQLYVCKNCQMWWSFPQQASLFATAKVCVSVSLYITVKLLKLCQQKTKLVDFLEILNFNTAANNWLLYKIKLSSSGILSREWSPISSVCDLIGASVFFVLEAGEILHSCQSVWVPPCKAVGPSLIYEEMKRVTSHTALFN